MATSGTLIGSKSQGLYLTFEWTRKSVDIENNTSVVSWSLKLNSENSLNFSADKAYTLNVNGESFNGTFTENINFGSGSNNVIIRSGESTIAHDASGKKTFSVNSVFNIAVTISNVYVASISLSGTITLDDIPRATTPIISPSSNLKMGDTVSFTLKPAMTTYKHTLTWKFGESVGTIAENVGTSTTWTIPRALANQIPNSLSGICVITCKTYNGTKLIGSKSINVSLKVNDSDVPTISSFSIDDENTNVKTKFNAFIQGKSKVKVNVNATGVYSSTIKSYKVRFGNLVYYTNSFTSDLLTSGEITVTATVTDSRNRTATETKKIIVLSYQTPTIKMFQCKRVDQSSQDDNQGTYLKASINFEISSLNNLNDKSYKIEYKSQGSETWQTLTSGSVYNFNNVFISSSGILNTDLAYTIRLSVFDYFTNAIYTSNVATAFVLLDFNSGGQGLAIGKVSENENQFDIAIPSYFRSGITQDCTIVKTGSVNEIVKSGTYYLTNEVTDRPITVNGWLEVCGYLDNYVLQRFTSYTGRAFERLMSSGTWGDWCGKFNNGTWEYEKMLDGTLKAYTNLEVDSLEFATKVADSWYRPATNSTITYPVTFTELPKIFFSTSIGGSSGSVLTYTVGSTTSGTGLWFQKLNTGTVNLKLAIEVLGKWK